MAKKTNWMDVEMADKPNVVVVDIGYLNDETARNRAYEIFALGVGRQNLIWGPSTGQMRIHIAIPKTKFTKVMAALPIQAEKTWFGSTHRYHAKPPPVAKKP